MTWLRYINNNGMTEWPGAHQIHDSSHQSINVLALIDLIGDWFPSLQLNPFPTWCLALSDSHSQDSGEHTHDESLTGQVNAHTHTHRVFFFVFGTGFVFGRERLRSSPKQLCVLNE